MKGEYMDGYLAKRGGALSVVQALLEHNAARGGRLPIVSECVQRD